MAIDRDPKKTVVTPPSSTAVKPAPQDQSASPARDDFSFSLDNLLRWWGKDANEKDEAEALTREEEFARLREILDEEFKSLTVDEMEAKGHVTIADIMQIDPNDPRATNMRVGELVDPQTGQRQYLTGRELTRYEVLHSAEGVLGRLGADGNRNSNFRITTAGEIRGEPILGKNIYNSQLLELIGKGESGGDYNRVFGKAKRIDLSNMTINEVIAWQKNYTSVEGSASSAAGKYQFIRKTLQATADEMGLSGNEKFNPAMQDRLAMHLLNQTGYSATLAGRMNEGKFADRVAGVWASLKSTSGRGVYDGDGLNAGKISAEMTIVAARMDKAIMANSEAVAAISKAKGTPEDSAAALRETAAALGKASESSRLGKVDGVEQVPVKGQLPSPKPELIPS